ncbi:MAG: TonB-dependent receptor [Saprospiraceae bacterium]|nr:TonB-dependent receptor [Saprospiraceae bacterium]
MKIVYIFLWHFCVPLSIYSQNLTVIDAKSNRPLEEVVIVSDNPSAIVSTNSKGRVDVSFFTDSAFIEIMAMGYKSQKMNYSDLVKSDFLIKMEASSFSLDEIVVSSSRWNQLSYNVPSKITSISNKEITLQNPQNAADLLGVSGEVFVQKSQQGGGSPMIRGYAANRLVYSVDGVRMNTAIFRSGNLQNVISLDPFAIEKTEVLFGPGSTMYGSDAIGGVMSFQTLSPKLSDTSTTIVNARALSRYSSVNNEKTFHFDGGLGWKKWSFLSSFSYSDFGDIKMGKNGPDEYLRTWYVRRGINNDEVVSNPDSLLQTPSRYSQYNFMQKVRFAPGKAWDITYGFHYSETSPFARYDRLLEERNNLPSFAEWNYGPQKWMMNLISVHHIRSYRLFDQMNIRLAQQSFEESRIDRRFQSFKRRTQIEKVDAFSINLDFEKKINHHSFIYGAEFVYNTVDSKGSAVDIRNQSPQQSADRYPASNWVSSAIFLQYHYTYSPKLMFQFGSRINSFFLHADFTRLKTIYPVDYTNIDLRHAAVTGSAGMVYRPAETWKLSAHLSTGFRAPNVDDLGKLFDFGPGEIVVPNPSLHSEYVYNVEFNISKVFFDVIKMDVTGYYSRLTNAMVRRPFTVNGQDSILYDGENSKVFAIQNAAFAQVIGANLGMEIKLGGGFTILSRYNIQVGKEETDNGEVSSSRHAVPNFGTTRLSFEKKGWVLQINAQYSEMVNFENLNPEERGKVFIYKKDKDGNPYSPSWYTLNVKSMYQLGNHLTFTAGVENITDQRYRPYSSGLVAGGRSLIISARVIL